jgi:hypothetical protein
MSDQFRVHLVIDTAGSARFWDVVGASEWRDSGQVKKPAAIDDQFIPFDDNRDAVILTENYNAPLVMHPGEVDALTMDIIHDMRACRRNPEAVMLAFERTMNEFRREWRRLWSLYGQSEKGWVHYESLIRHVKIPRVHLMLASNDGSATHTFGARVLMAALSVSLAEQYLQDSR